MIVISFRYAFALIKPTKTSRRYGAIWIACATGFRGIVNLCSGRSESPENIERGYRHGFVIDFADRDALATYAAYQDYPDHRAFDARLVAATATDGAKDGLLVFDMPINVR